MPLPRFPLAFLASLAGTGLVRLLGVVVLLLACCVAAHSQEQEQMMKRIMEPDMTKRANIKNFNKGYNAKGFTSKSARIKEFHGSKNYRGKDFATKDYNAVRRSTQAEMKYGTRNVDTEGRGGAARLVKEHQTEAHSVKEARDAGKSSRTREYATREAKWRGLSQDKIDREGPAAMASIQEDGSFRKLETIDDIRQLLNELD